MTDEPGKVCVPAEFLVKLLNDRAQLRESEIELAIQFTEMPSIKNGLTSPPSRSKKSTNKNKKTPNYERYGRSLTLGNEYPRRIPNFPIRKILSQR